MSDTESVTSIGICVPTIRIEQARRFLEEWAPYWRRSAGHCAVTVFLHEDRESKGEIARDATGLPLVHTCHADIERVLGERAWIIPRRSGACRSFPMLLAFRHGCEFVVTMDDDCLPAEQGGETFLDDHLGAFRLDRWFRTIDGVATRGLPYGDRGRLPVLLNHGLWTGNPDLDGPTTLALRDGTQVVLRASREVVPPGMWFPLCAMNVCYRRAALPAAYNLLMGLDTVGLDRFDDIWSGLLLKRIADQLGLYVTSGIPRIHHQRASNPFVNLRKEALGIHLHEFFWRHVERAPLDRADTLSHAYRRLADWVRLFPQEQPKAPKVDGYFESLGEAMLVWSELFDDEGAALVETE